MVAQRVQMGRTLWPVDGDDWEADKPVFDANIDPPLGGITWASCVDGLSSTLLVSEVANGPAQLDAGRTSVSDCYQLPLLAIDTPAGLAIAACNAVDWRTGPIPWLGTWCQGVSLGGGHDLEDLVQHDSDAQKDMLCKRYRTDVGWWWMMRPCSSYHPGLVNVGLADGA